MNSSKNQTKSQKQLQYEEEYLKYKDILITPGLYKSKQNIEHEVVSIDYDKELAMVTTIHSDFTKQRTLHWCRKNLVKE